MTELSASEAVVALEFGLEVEKSISLKNPLPFSLSFPASATNSNGVEMLQEVETVSGLVLILPYFIEIEFMCIHIINPDD